MQEKLEESIADGLGRERNKLKYILPTMTFLGNTEEITRFDVSVRVP